MKILSVLACAAFLVVGTTVGLRMLALARRTRALPELFLGAGLTSLTFVTLPLVGVGLGLKPGSLALQQGMFAGGMLPVIGFATGLFAFTALVFRPRSPIAWTSVAAAGVVASVATAGLVMTRLAAWDADRVVSAHWSVLLIGVFVAGFLWTGVESLHHHRMLRRRVAIGLADPAVCDRMRLWGIGSLGAVVGTSALIFSLLHGWRVVNHPVPILAIAVAGFSVSITWYLAFLPPDRYLARLRSA